MAVVFSNYSAVISQTVSSGYVKNATDLYFNIPWYPASLIDRVRIWNTSSVSTTFTEMIILNNGAHFRSGSPTAKDLTFYQDTTTVTPFSVNNYTAIYSINPAVFTEDLYSRPYITIKIKLSSGSEGVFYCNVQGRKAYGTSYKNVDNTHVSSIKDFRVLMGKSQTGVGYTAGSIIDFSNVQAGVANSAEFAFTSNTDKLYVGSKKKIDHWEILLNQPISASAGLTAEYWNGTAWTVFTALDNTSAGSAFIDTMKYSGIIEGVGLATSQWVPVKFDFDANFRLPKDPLTELQKKVMNGTTTPQLLPENSERYWVRFGIGGTVYDAYLKGVLPIDEIY
jgi:hypothetical protein